MPVPGGMPGTKPPPPAKKGPDQKASVPTPWGNVEVPTGPTGTEVVPATFTALNWLSKAAQAAPPITTATTGTPAPQGPPPGYGGGRSYTIAPGDNAWKVAQRFTGEIKRADGRWVWKELDHAYPPMETTGSVPSPWQPGQVFAMPAHWTTDLGPSANASGAVGPASVSGEDFDQGDEPLQTV